MCTGAGGGPCICGDHPSPTMVCSITPWHGRSMSRRSIRFLAKPYLPILHPIYIGEKRSGRERIPGEKSSSRRSRCKMAGCAVAGLADPLLKATMMKNLYREAYYDASLYVASYPMSRPIETAAAAMLRGATPVMSDPASAGAGLPQRGCNSDCARSRTAGFNIWQPEAVDAECWPVAPGEDWHGFKDADADLCIRRSGEGQPLDAGHRADEGAG